MRVIKSYFCLKCRGQIQTVTYGAFDWRWSSSILVTRFNVYTLCITYTYSKGTSGSQINSNRTDLPLSTQPCASYINTKFHKHQALAINSTYLKGYHLVLHTQHEMKLFHMTADINYFKENIQNFEGDFSHLDAHPKFGVPKCVYMSFLSSRYVNARFITRCVKWVKLMISNYSWRPWKLKVTKYPNKFKHSKLHSR